jgi:hypothetical protein
MAAVALVEHQPPGVFGSGSLLRSPMERGDVSSFNGAEELPDPWQFSAGRGSRPMPHKVLRPLIEEEWMDEDLQTLNRNELMAEVKRLRAGIRAHRNSSGHALCWHHPQLWGLLPEPIPTDCSPAWPQFLRGCIRYREALDRELRDAPRIDAEYDGSGRPNPDR